MGAVGRRTRESTAPFGVGPHPSAAFVVIGPTGAERCVTASPRPIAAVTPVSDPDISFVLVTYGTGGVVIDAIESLAASLATDDVAYEVIVVDNEHPIRARRTSTQLLLDTSGVHLVRPHRNLGFAAGCNLGVALARGTNVGFVNPDVEFPPDWLPPLIDALDGDAAIAAPVLREPDGAVQSAGHRLHADGSTAPVAVAPRPGEVGRPHYASAACWIMRRATFDRIGGFDESFFPAYYEDVDFALRAREIGGTVVVGDSSVVHHRGGSTDSAQVPDTTPQRLRLLENWPSLASTQPTPPSRAV